MAHCTFSHSERMNERSLAKENTNFPRYFTIILIEKSELMALLKVTMTSVNREKCNSTGTWFLFERLLHPRRSKKQSSAYGARGTRTNRRVSQLTTGVPRFISWKYVRRGICLGVESVVDADVIYRQCNRTLLSFSVSDVNCCQKYYRFALRMK